ncbi:histidine phosphatase family protein [Kutzneria buriramensis]|uniref:Putative phosphoglycerate mutase n=1 Tax=Kutzneria buriramensis TaxID=1045776 RepID=A0A3E0G6J4_9PSEU|nr:histidine phosphatase family protein [Kutzneria buriramensis]REH18140.1 putative phosphoglycerate mutase [Kutzneria buriramensis]
MDVVLIRHGQTKCTVRGRFCGSHEGDLTDVGWRMAECVAENPALQRVSAIVCSPARRAVGTASVLAERLGAAVTVDDRLRELHFGQWEDRLRADVDSGLLARWEGDPALFSPPGGETGLEVMARAVAAVRDVALGGSKVAVVTHKAPVRLVLAYFLGLAPGRYRDIGVVSVGSVSRVQLEGGRAVLKALGDVSHLPAAWRADPDHAVAMAGESV